MVVKRPLLVLQTILGQHACIVKVHQTRCIQIYDRNMFCKNGYWANIFIIYTDFALVLEKNNQYKNGCIWFPNKCSMLSTFSFFLFIRIIDFNPIRTRYIESKVSYLFLSLSNSILILH